AEIVYRGLPAHPLHPGLGTGRDLRDDLLDRVIAAVFLEDRDALRDEAAFQARLAGSRAGMGLPAQEIARTVQATLERLARVLAALPRVAAATAADIRSQLAWLVPSGFVRLTPTARLRELPRYLQAIEQRLEKALR